MAYLQARIGKILWKATLHFGLIITCGAAMAVPQTGGQSVRRFVQNFYDWYSRAAQKRHLGPAWVLALNKEKGCFSGELLRGLREDASASAGVKGEINGLDFDPFLGSQDPADHYSVERIAQKERHYNVTVFSESGKIFRAPAVVAVIERRDGSWCFTNIVYPNGQNLIDILRQLRRSRSKHATPDLTNRPPSVSEFIRGVRQQDANQFTRCGSSDLCARL